MLAHRNHEGRKRAARTKSSQPEDTVRQEPLHDPCQCKTRPKPSESGGELEKTVTQVSRVLSTRLPSLADQSAQSDGSKNHLAVLVPVGEVELEENQVNDAATRQLC
jgi:hypothetical protein